MFGGNSAIVGTMIDNTDRRRAEIEVREQLNFIAQLVETIPSPVFYKDEQGHYLGCNRAFEQFIGFPRQQLIGKSVRDIAPNELAELYFAADNALFDQPGVQTYEAVVQSADMVLRDMVIYKATFNKSDGSVGGLVGVMLDITDRKASDERIRYLAMYDTMTGLPNRTLFMDRLKQAMATADRNQRGLAVLLLDLNRFKEINDTKGHGVGDLVLVEVGRRFQSMVREEETLARLAGDEFALVAEASDQLAAFVVAERLQQVLFDSIEADGHTFAVEASIGISFYPQDGTTVEDLLKRADIAMYRAKDSGGGYRAYQPEMSAGLAERVQMAKDLSRALLAGKLELYFQPKVTLSTGKLNGAEALLRWNDPERGWINPAEFIPIAEARGMMNALGKWVLAEACRQMREWQEAGLHFPGRLAVNISTQQLEETDFADNVRSTVSEAQLMPTCLELELTESGLMGNVERAIVIMDALKRIGFSLSIDDFGTGYSSLSYLKRLPADTLKIDISFVRDMLHDHHDYTIVNTIIGMARNLGLKATAEGVEEVAQADALLALGCDEAQGYYFGRPEPAHVFAMKWLEKESQ
jgi:diguanylate cyclase (GGDEF)-like protein/PAS domain S-box-containing protein